MSADDGRPPRHAQRRFLSQSLTALLVELDELHADLSSTGDVRRETKQNLQSELATVIVQLRQYRDEENVVWKEYTEFEEGPDGLLRRILEGDVTDAPAQGQHNAGSEPAPAPAEIDTNVLYVSALDIIDLANELGLAPEIDESTETTYPDPV